MVNTIVKNHFEVDAERPHWNTVHIRTGYQKLAWFILGRQAGADILGCNPQIARNMGKSHSFRWAILWIILLYMCFLNKRSNFEKKPLELSYRSNILLLSTLLLFFITIVMYIWYLLLLLSQILISSELWNCSYW